MKNLLLAVAVILASVLARAQTSEVELRTWNRVAEQELSRLGLEIHGLFLGVGDENQTIQHWEVSPKVKINDEAILIKSLRAIKDASAFLAQNYWEKTQNNGGYQDGYSNYTARLALIEKTLQALQSPTTTDKIVGAFGYKTIVKYKPCFGGEEPKMYADYPSCKGIKLSAAVEVNSDSRK